MTATIEDVKKMLENAILLYDGIAPGSEGLTLEEVVFEEVIEDGSKKVLIKDVIAPKLIPFIPEQPNGTAVIIIPGGGFRRQVLNFEGIDVARWLNEQGIAAFILCNRYPINDHKVPADVPLIDTQRAVRIVRSRWEEFGICPDKIGVMGFSAGGHAASAVAVAYDAKPYDFEDKLEHISARPDFAVLGYPAIAKEIVCKDTKKVLAERKYVADVFEKYSTEKMVHANMPPVFIFETDDDKTTPAENSVLFYLAARRAGVSAELHIFKQGTHGFGLGDTRKQVGMWKKLFLEWLEVEIG